MIMSEELKTKKIRWVILDETHLFPQATMSEVMANYYAVRTDDEHNNKDDE
jgi:hypothetical protein